MQFTVLNETKLISFFFFFLFFTSGVFSFCGNGGRIFGQLVGRNQTEPGYPDYQIMPLIMSQDSHFLNNLDITLRPDVSKIGL